MTNKANQAPAKPQFVGIDDGRASVKLYAGNGVKLKIRTSVCAGQHVGSTGIAGEAGDAGCYETDGQVYTVGDRIDGEDTRFETYDGSAINRVAVHQALVIAGFSEKVVKIATGLPVSSYFLSGKPNNEVIKEKRGSIAIKTIAMNKQLPCALISDNIVLSEALAAWLDDVLDEDGNVKPNVNMKDPVGIVDFGGRTIDTVWINPPNMIDHRRSGSEQIGVLDLYDLVGDSLRAKYKVGQLSREAMELAVSGRKVRLHGVVHDVTDIVEECSSEIQGRIEREIQRRLGNTAELDRILFVGGGSAAIPKIAQAYPNAVMVKDPEFANARGMYKFLRHLEGQK